MDAADFLRDIVDPHLATLSEVAGKDMATDEARVMVLSICAQESALEYRRQVKGPARGWPQMERGGGCKGVMQHPSTSAWAKSLCDRYCIPFDLDSVYEALAWHDGLAIGFARLLLYSDTAPLPPIPAPNAAWDMYLRNWRPGKPNLDRWAEVYPKAQEAVERGRAYVPATVPVPVVAEVQQTIVEPAPVQDPAVTERLLRLLRSGVKTSEFWVGLVFGLGPFILQALDVLTQAVPELQSARWVGIAYIIARALPKFAAALPLVIPQGAKS